MMVSQFIRRRGQHSRLLQLLRHGGLKACHATVGSTEREVQAAGKKRSKGVSGGERAVRPNQSLKRSANGMPPGPGLRYSVYFLSPGPGVIPSSPA